MYGVSPERFAQMVVSQDGRCRLCTKVLDLRGGRGPDVPHIDHDRSHCPGKRSCGACVRALLCGRCNPLIGMAGDDPDLLELIAGNLRSMKAESAAFIAGQPVQGELPIDIKRAARRAADG